MKPLLYIACIVLLAGCGGKKATPAKDTLVAQNTATIKKASVKANAPSRDSSSKEPALLLSNLPFNFAVSDTGYFNFVIGDGIYAVIKNNGILIDTIDAYYGFQKVDNERYMYLTIEGNSALTPEYSDPKYKKSIAANLGNYVIIDKSSFKIKVDSLAPDFGWFANPSIINGRIYYWQVKQESKKGNNFVSAAEFDPTTQKTKKQFLFKDYIETDASNYFEQPSFKNGVVVFNGFGEKEYKFSPDFKLIK